MKRKLVQATIVIFLFILWTAASPAKAAVVTVNNSGDGNFTSIQEAVNNAHDRDTVLVSPGVYRENIIVNRELTIVSHSTLSGSQTDRTYIIGTVSNNAIFNISSDNVTINGFHIAGGPFEKNMNQEVGLYLDGVQNCSLNSNTLILIDQGIVLKNSQGNYLNGNLVSFGNEGIALDNSEENVLSNNWVVKNNQGISLNNSFNNTLVNNTAGSNEAGVLLQMSQGNTLAYNLILKNEYGVLGQIARSNIFTSNNFYLNGIGVNLRSSSNNSFYENEFISFLNAADEGNNVWNSSLAGNFWNDHTGADADGNGIIDIQYVINQTSEAIDYKPMVNRISSGNSSKALSSNGNTLLVVFEEKYPEKKYPENSMSSRKKGLVIETSELGQINSSLEEGPVFLKLGAEWCGACQSMKPILDELAAEYGGKATILSININKNPQLATYFDVGYIPDSSVIVGIENGEYIYMQQDGNATTDRVKARIVGLENKEIYEKVLEHSLAYEEKGKSE
ncbi:NosD domain-containing protein [Methanosarcina sp. UBA5]|uniref:NosD domain-containing protein n=1 Tax=Methanosarcina sp. UBA5 TaxID=1915593 RepID=UPI0025F04A81|nr:NosD domain-containing protein [Methanosarcina sp. UBA5]